MYFLICKMYIRMVINFCCIQFREAQIHVDVLQVEVLFFFLHNFKKTLF